MRRGIRLWELRERVRTGATARPEKLTWASQPTVLDYDATHVIYAMLSKRGGKVPYVGVTSMSSWERWKTRMATVHLGEKGDKEALSIPFTRHLVRGGTASAMYDQVIFPLEQVPPPINTAAGGHDWVAHVRPWERWWIHHLSSEDAGWLGSRRF